MLRLLTAPVTGLSIRLTLLACAVAIALPIPVVAQTSIASGGAFTLVAKSDGTAWAFGFNNNGQLADNSFTTQAVPDMFTIEPGATGTIVRGVTSGGEVKWVAQAPGYPLMSDSFGGIVAGLPAAPAPYHSEPRSEAQSALAALQAAV